jgi:hypothetical protein
VQQRLIRVSSERESHKALTAEIVQPTLEQAQPSCWAIRAAGSLKGGLALAPGSDPESASSLPRGASSWRPGHPVCGPWRSAARNWRWPRPTRPAHDLVDCLGSPSAPSCDMPQPGSGSAPRVGPRAEPRRWARRLRHGGLAHPPRCRSNDRNRFRIRDRSHHPIDRGQPMRAVRSKSAG